MKSISAVIGFCALLGLWIPSVATAHGADDHEHAAAPSVAVAPRASAQTEDVELVAVLQGRHLIIYLDRFADNAAVIDAQIEVESGNSFKAVAKQTSPGVYVIDLAAGVLEKAGKYPLAISVQAGDLGDVMTATLEIPEDSADEHESSAGFWNSMASKWKWLVAALIVLTSSIFAVRVMRKRAHANSLGGGK